MNRFLLLALAAGLLCPIEAKAKDDFIRDTCGRHSGGFISSKEAHRRLGLEKTSKMMMIDKEPVNFNDESPNMQYLRISSYCDGYTGSRTVNTSN